MQTFVWVCVNVWYSYVFHIFFIDSLALFEEWHTYIHISLHYSVKYKHFMWIFLFHCSVYLYKNPFKLNVKIHLAEGLQQSGDWGGGGATAFWTSNRAYGRISLRPSINIKSHTSDATLHIQPFFERFSVSIKLSAAASLVLCIMFVTYLKVEVDFSSNQILKFVWHFTWMP